MDKLCIYFIIFTLYSASGVLQHPVLIKAEIHNDFVHYFPDNFSFGASTAAYQIEGGWNADGKVPSIWDSLTHFHKEMIVDHRNADVGPDSYHFYKKDIESLKFIGFQHYRFSISWSRILSNASVVNRKGIEYYNKLIDELIINNIEPVATMYHYDLPQWIQELGGLTNVIFVKYFKYYADVLFREFGSRIKIWITFNEPFETCVEGYGTGSSAPIVSSSGVGEYLCGHNLLVAHAAAYHLYKDKYANDQRGMIGISLDGRFYYPKDAATGPEVIQRAINFETGWFAHPIYSKNGGYPKVMIDEINSRSKKEGRPWSRLPEMSKELKKYIRGTADFLGYNYYTSRFVELDDSEYDPSKVPSWQSDTRIKTSVDPNWKRAKSSWLYSVPDGIRGLMNWIRAEYHNIPVLITENGWSDDGELNDDGRIEYLRNHLIALAQAINEDHCNVIGYTVWSIIDNFEWRRGYTEHFGLYAVNMTSNNRERISKKSAKFLRDFIMKRFIK